MTLTGIQNLKIDNYWEILSYRLLPNLTNDKINVQGTKYSDIMLNNAFTKPSLLKYESEFILYKQELVAVEQTRLDKIARQKAISLRIDALEDFHSLLVIAGLQNIPNGLVEFNRIIREEDTATLKKLEDAFIIHKASTAKKAAIQLKKDIGNKQKLACEECLSIIRGDNNNKTDAEINSMLTIFAEIYSALTQHRPTLSRALITAVPNDGTIDILKQELLDELAEHGF